MSATISVANQLILAPIEEGQIAVIENTTHDGKEPYQVAFLTANGTFHWQTQSPRTALSRIALGAYTKVLAMLDEGVGVSMNLLPQQIANFAANYAVRCNPELDEDRRISQGVNRVLQLLQTHPATPERTVIATLAQDRLIPDHAGVAYLLHMLTDINRLGAFPKTGMPKAMENAYVNGDWANFANNLAEDLINHPPMLEAIKSLDHATYQAVIEHIASRPVTDANTFSDLGPALTTQGKHRGVLLKKMAGLLKNTGMEPLVSLVTTYQETDDGDFHEIGSAVLNKQELRAAIGALSDAERVTAYPIMTPDAYQPCIDGKNNCVLTIQSIDDQPVSQTNFLALIDGLPVTINNNDLRLLGPHDNTQPPTNSPTMG